jgi:hypothetical protein
MAGILNCRWCAAAAVLLALVALPGCKGNKNLTKANYEKIASGMTLAEVEALLGGRGDDSAEGLDVAEGSGVAGAVGVGGDLQSMGQGKSRYKTYQWGSGKKWIRVTFMDGKVALANFKQEQGLQ